MKTAQEIFATNLQREIGKLEQSVMNVPKEMEKHSDEGFIHPQRFFDHCVRVSKIETLKIVLSQAEGFNLAHFMECATGFGAAHPTASNVGWMQAQCFALEAWQDAQEKGAKSLEELQRELANAQKALDEAKTAHSKEWDKKFVQWQLAAGMNWHTVREDVVAFLEGQGVEIHKDWDGNSDWCGWWVTTTHEQTEAIKTELSRLFGDNILE